MLNSMLRRGIFLSLLILSAIFNVSVLGFSMYFCLKNNKDLYLFIYLFISDLIWLSRTVQRTYFIIYEFCFTCFK